MAGRKRAASDASYEPCIECLHDMLTASRSLGAGAELPGSLRDAIRHQCSRLHHKLEGCKHRRVVVGEMLCPTHSGLVNELLGSDLLRRCFAFLDSRDLCSAANVCRLWRRVSQDDALWRRLLERLPHSNFVPAPHDLRHGGGCDAISEDASRRAFMAYRQVAWDESFADRRVRDTQIVVVRGDPLSSGQLPQQSARISHNGRRVLASTGSGRYQFFDHRMLHAEVGGADGRPYGRRYDRRTRSALRAHPPLRRGKGAWTVQLKKLYNASVNAVGVAVGVADEEHQAEEGVDGAVENGGNGGIAGVDGAGGPSPLVVWLFNTDGSESGCQVEWHNLRLPNQPEADVVMMGWHGFGDVVTPSFWRVAMDCDADEITLSCGMSEEAGCALVTKGGILRQLVRRVRGRAGEDPAEDAAVLADWVRRDALQCHMIVLLQDSVADLVRCANAQ